MCENYVNTRDRHKIIFKKLCGEVVRLGFEGRRVYV
jgi:hypothetical protein